MYNCKASCFNFTCIGSATRGCPATLEVHIIPNSSTTTLEVTVIQLHVDGGAGVAVEGQDMKEGN